MIDACRSHRSYFFMSFPGPSARGLRTRKLSLVFWLQVSIAGAGGVQVSDDGAGALHEGGDGRVGQNMQR